MRNSTIIIAKGIKLDKAHKNILNYTTNQMIALIQEHKVAEANNFSFIRARGTISTEFNYSDVLHCNYMAFQNPDYDNKWFFAFIDEAVYISNGCTEIRYTIDNCVTWWDDFTVSSCYVEREHTNNDAVGANTQPEGLNLGQSYIITEEGIFALASNTESNTMRFGMLLSGPATPDATSYDISPTNFGGVLCGLTPCFGIPISDTNSIRALITNYVQNGTEDRIVKTFQYPTILGDLEHSKNGFSSTIEIPAHDTLDGYIPHNNKLLTYPYIKLRAYSTDGDSVELQFELFDAEEGGLNIKGSILPTCKFRLCPSNYGGVDLDYSKAIVQNAEIPVAWVGDAYTQWVANNKMAEGIGLAVSAISSAGAIVGGGMTGNPAMLAGGVLSLGSSIAGTINDFEQAKHASSSVHGSIGGDGIAVKEGSFGFVVQTLTIKEEYAKMIDAYFDKYGYATNKLKTPNITGRPFYNYVKISNDSCIGYGNIPSLYMEEINNVFSSGVTVWHNHANLGDYSVDNSI